MVLEARSTSTTINEVSYGQFLFRRAITLFEIRGFCPISCDSLPLVDDVGTMTPRPRQALSPRDREDVVATVQLLSAVRGSGEAILFPQKRGMTMAQYADLMYAPKVEVDSEPTSDDHELYDRHSEELQSSGAMVAAFALEDPSRATSLRGNLITDEPYLETKEVIVGFYVIETPEFEAASVTVRANPIVQRGGGVEVRPVAGGVVVTP